MLYLEHRPHPALVPFIKALWYARDPNATIHRQERVLPNGHAQIVISLARDYLTDANNALDPLQHTPAAILLGIYSRHQQIDTIDLAELIGIVFQPGGTLPFFPADTDLFSNCETSLEDIWGRASEDLRNDLREAPTPEKKFAILESALLHRLSQSKSPHRSPVIDFALTHLHRSPGTTTIAELTRQIGLSSRHLSQLFREQVGVSPKIYCRIQRFQQVVQHLHQGVDIRWAELALTCGYYDQSHFANDFRAFSGLSPTTYSATQRRWSNHIPLN
ncbi:MAG: AraC family transcriptional regulator [Edaphobacter sp.]|nr:AraC family transcriptional regulator [Edaphobacter sp.]